MAWSETLLEASYRGVKFDCQSIDDSFEKANVEHSFPFVAGAEIEDMGRSPRRVSVQAIFDGSDYEIRLQAFITELEKPGAGELIHPVFGSMKNAQVVLGSIHHEADNVDQATVLFELIESTAGNPFFGGQSALQAAEAISQQSQAARNASAFSLSGLMTKLKALNPMSQLTELRQTMLGPVFQLKALGGGVLTSGMDVIGYPLSWAGDLTSLSAGVMNIGGFSSDNLLTDYKNSYRRLTNTLSSGSTVYSQPAGVLIDGSAASRIDAVKPTEAGTQQAAKVHVQVEKAASTADAAAAVLAAESQTATLTPTDIESVTNIARIDIETAIALVRIVYPLETGRPIVEGLKDTALALQQAAQAVIIVRPPLITRQVEAPAPLRLLAHRWYGDHSRAIELQRLNGLRDPNFLQVHQALLAYAR